jgi:hypothetical protein
MEEARQRSLGNESQPTDVHAARFARKRGEQLHPTDWQARRSSGIDHLRINRIDCRSNAMTDLATFMNGQRSQQFAATPQRQDSTKPEPG